MRAGVEDKAIVKSVIHGEFASGGYVPNKNLVEKLGGIPSWVVRRHYDDVVAAIPDREEVDLAYERFLDLACAGALCDELIAAGSAARVTARRIAIAVGEEPDTVAKRAKALGLKLARTEHRYAAASRLAPATAQRLTTTGLSKARLQRIAGVPAQTFAQRLQQAAGQAAGGAPGSSIIDDNDVPPIEKAVSTEAAAPATTRLDTAQGHISLAPMTVRGFTSDAIDLAARQILLRDGRDPDELVAGVYRRGDGEQARLECDRIEIVDGRPTPHVAVYRVEADRIASIVTLVEAAAARLPA